MNLLLTEYEERNVAGFEIDKCEEKKSLKNICVITNGCPENRIDCSRTQQFLIDNGYTVTADVQDADVIVFNSCGLTEDTQEGSIKIIEDFNIESGKTKDLAKVLKNHVNDEKTLIILKDDSKLVKQAGRNIPWLDILSYNKLRAHNMYYVKKLIILETAVNKLNEFYGDDK